MYPNIFKGELLCTFKRNKNVGDYFVSVKLKLDPSVGGMKCGLHAPRGMKCGISSQSTLKNVHFI